MSREERRTIEDEIRRLGHQTEAPASFIEQVTRFFQEKTISLRADAEPYLLALEQAFLLEESVRRGSLRARENLVHLQDCLRLVGATYQQQLAQLRRVRDSLEQQNRVVREGTQRLRDLGRSTSRQQTQILLSFPKGTFLVPGPRDLQ